jgi:uncharacterized protein (DUF1778 family)
VGDIGKIHGQGKAEHPAVAQALLDRRMIAVSPKAYAEFLARLDEPPAPHDRLLRTMRATPPWK